mgnify:CR=1 FL=1
MKFEFILQGFRSFSALKMLWKSIWNFRKSGFGNVCPGAVREGPGAVQDLQGIPAPPRRGQREPVVFTLPKSGKSALT